MSDLEICRICLIKGVKVFNFNHHNLKEYYEDVMSKKVEEDGLPQFFCYECAAMLYKYCKFKEKCQNGERELRELLWNGPISLSSVSQIDREGKKLISSIDIITVNKRVKTLNVKNKNLSRKFSRFKLPEIEEMKVDYDSDTSVDERNLANIKKEIINKIKQNGYKNIKIDKESIKTETVSSIELYNADDEMNSDSFTGDNKTGEIKEEESKTEIAFDEENISFDSIPFNDDKINEENVIQEQKNKINGKRKKSGDLEANKNDLDPSHWLKINLNEEQALDEFKLRAQDSKYLSAAYKCTDCFKGFSQEDMLNRHIKLRHSESLGQLTCRFCNMRFKLNCYLTRHMTQHYTKYKCLRCDLICPLKNTALFHNDYHNGVIRKCMHCGEDFRHLSTYYTHLRTHRSEHVCSFCGASFVSTKGLNMHKRTMHVNTVINREEINTYCERCNIRFDTQKAYKEHLFHSAMHAEGTEDVVNETSAKSIPKDRKKSIRRNPRKFTPCAICNRNFSTQTAYMKHHAAEHKDRPIPSKDNERQICEICGVSLAASSVASHLNTHTREKMYTCSTCGMQFNSKSSMTRHQLTHTGEKPYNCTLCDKRFTQKCSMKLHYRTYHLKEPYPKRNRRKKGGNLQEALEEYRNDTIIDTIDNLKVNVWR